MRALYFLLLQASNIFRVQFVHLSAQEVRQEGGISSVRKSAAAPIGKPDVHSVTRKGSEMFDEAELRRMSHQERARLTRALARLDAPQPLANPVNQRRRRLVIAFTLLCVLVLAVWIGVLAVTLPPHYRSGGWRTAWVGFDGALLLVFAAASWAVWRRRQILIMCLVVLATLLCADAWFDTTLDWGTRGFMPSLLTALLVELPLAGVMLLGTRRLMRLTVRRLEALEGLSEPLPPFWRVPLFGDESLGYRHLWTQRGAECAESLDGDSPAGPCHEGEPHPAHEPRSLPRLADVGPRTAAGPPPTLPAAAEMEQRAEAS